MKTTLRRWFASALLALVAALFLASAFVAWKPREVLLWAAGRWFPEAQFTLGAAQWKKGASLELENAHFGSLIKIPKATLAWNWGGLWDRHFEELKLERVEIFLDLVQLEKLRATAPLASAKSRSSFRPWHLDRLALVRGGLVMVGLGPTVPPLSMELEGVFQDVPLGGDLSEADLQKLRTIEVKNLHIHSPLDVAVTVLSMESVALHFSLEGLRSRQLDSLVFHQPVLDVDRGLFWFVDELRHATALRPKAHSPDPDWIVKKFFIREGRLDISRLKEIAIQYPFEFEVSRENLNLRALSLAEFQIELTIPEQDIRWEAMDISFDRLHGKIGFNLAAPESQFQIPTGGTPPPNDLVNTLYVGSIRWRELKVSDSWLSLTFDSKRITGAYGGAFARGYVNGGMAFGWSGKEAWRFWGAAANVETGIISRGFHNEAFTMNGRAELGFDMQGESEELKGNLKLKSLSPGVVEIRALQRVLDRVQKNTVGIKREVMEAFLRSLREYPYRNYDLEMVYSKPDAALNFRSESGRGSRKIDVQWHGVKYD